MLEEKLYQDYVTALKAKDKVKSQFLGFVRADLLNKAKDLKVEKLDDPQVLELLKKQLKRLQDTKDSIVKACREELLADADNELAMLKAYLPEQIDETALIKIVEDVIAQTGASSMKDMGNTIKVVIAKTAGAADSKMVSQIVKTKLSS